MGIELKWKSLILRDLELFKKFKDIEVGFTITTADEGCRRAFEPRTVPVEERIGALERLHQAHIKTYVMIAPPLQHSCLRDGVGGEAEGTGCDEAKEEK